MSVSTSVVHWFPDKEAQKCGYCKKLSSSVQYGMWAQSLTVFDYQDLIDRGWRRSGQYCYKPVNEETCCPLYTIKCNALEFQPTKSQKKVIKKVNKFLRTGELKEQKEVGEQIEGEAHEEPCPPKDVLINISPELVAQTTRPFKEGIGADPNKPPCKKAKLTRREKKNTNLNNTKKQQGKSLEEFLSEHNENDKHKLTVKLIEPNNPSSDWQKYQQIEFELFKQYQEVIHNDHNNTLEGFRRFLVNSPLERETVDTSDALAYGSYHQQYWVDDKLIAVGVIDILPKCVSAVYFFYDVHYRELTLGTYGALRETQLARELYATHNTQYYYMGFYIHTCPKMRYKGNMQPSFLLCPETYQWSAIKKALEKLEKSKYSRLNDDIDAIDTEECSSYDLDDINIYYKNYIVTYKSLRKTCDLGSVYTSIGKLVGKKCAKNMIFVHH